MEKILFVNKYPTNIPENLKYKFDGEMDACIKLGYQVWDIEWDGEVFYLVCKNGHKRIPLLKAAKKNELRYYHTLYFVDLYRCVNLVVRKMRFDYLYMRYMPFFPPLAKSLDIAKKAGMKIIIEIPTYPFEHEQENEKRIYRRVFFKMTKGYQNEIFKKADLLAVCGNIDSDKLYGVRVVSFLNGINPDAFPVRQPTDTMDEVHVLLLASMCYWHGYERVIEGLKLYSGDKKVVLHFVGADGDGSLSKWKDLSIKYNLMDNIIFHGPLYDEDLNKIFDLADVGISSIGIHFPGYDDKLVATPLKTREYMNRGLPFVVCNNVVSTGEELPFVMHVKSDNSPIDISEVVSFALRNKEIKETPKIMHQYAEENMSWVTEFKRIMGKVKS